MDYAKIIEAASTKPARLRAAIDKRMVAWHLLCGAKSEYGYAKKYGGDLRKTGSWVQKSVNEYVTAKNEVRRIMQEACLDMRR